MTRVEVRGAEAGDAALAGAVLAAGYGWRFAGATEAEQAIRFAHGRDPSAVLVALSGGAVVGVALLSRHGDVAMIDALCAHPRGGGVGGALVDAACEQAEEWGAGSVRVRAPAGDPTALALLASRSFSVVDVAARLARAPVAGPRLDAARGLEIAAPRPADVDALCELDRRLTGLERRGLYGGDGVMCARRRGNLVGFLAQDGASLGPGIGLDMADLGVMIARALSDRTGETRAVLSTAAPTAMLAAGGLGFRAEAVELVMVRGPAPPARPAQLY